MSSKLPRWLLQEKVQEVLSEIQDKNSEKKIRLYVEFCFDVLKYEFEDETDREGVIRILNAISKWVRHELADKTFDYTYKFPN